VVVCDKVTKQVVEELSPGVVTVLWSFIRAQREVRASRASAATVSRKRLNLVDDKERTTRSRGLFTANTSVSKE
jgi:hypothetical protein